MHRCITAEEACRLWDDDQALEYAVGVAGEDDVVQAHRALQARLQAQLQDRSSCKHMIAMYFINSSNIRAKVVFAVKWTAVL